MNIIKRNSPNHNVGRNGTIPDMIVCHISEGSFDSALLWLTNPQSRVSAHFVVARDGRIVQLVAIEDTAWANGTSNTPDKNSWHGHSTLESVRTRAINANRYTISIEHEGRQAETNGALTPAQLEATIQLVAHIRAEVRRIYNHEIPLNRRHLVGHNEITPRTRPLCPGAKFPFNEIIRRLTAEVPHDPPSDFARDAWEWAIKNRLVDGTNPKGNATREQMVTLLMRYDRLKQGVKN
ncbi:MAG: N-acetylmuramoyl-L-alanine amidase [Defluviitaleaceae bacterium]|nr:N-acetylmuramoyl-L-alanine amidase [Defluviitaleaceae bacterium]MCL2275902.1 N-acetylmuramoyl-L-alanine amidase [Defluviitaleaceae bacterium]